jgi:single-stranded-DNA-specific exonuclease
MRWIPKPFNADVAATLEREAGLDPLTARLLAQRGISSADEANRFLHPSVEHLHSPYLMLGMAAAVERLERAISAKEQILIYGDYDVDGTVAVVVLKTCIELLGGQADFHVPHRIREGYGMKDDVIERAADAGVSLVISVDTGIRAFAAAETAARCGLDLIVTDHHLPEIVQGVPHALAVLNPNQHGCEYPCKSLCGAGVAFKVAQALLEKHGQQRLLPSFLKIVALATIADSVALTGENRTMAALGLQGLARPVNVGLRALMEVAQLSHAGRALTTRDVAFRLAPRINAAGRMDVAQDVVELFTTKDAQHAAEIARKLDRLNSERQAEEARVLESIDALLAAEPALRESGVVVLHGEGWHRGVIGIVATRVVERTGRPALVISCDAETGEGHGSGRSIAGFHLLDALESEAVRPLFTRFGGHSHAVGFSLATQNISELRRALDDYAAAKLSAEDLEPALDIDADLSLAEIGPELLKELAGFAPFGVGNPEPVFAIRDARLCAPVKMLKEKHAKLRVTEGSGQVFDALGWRMAESIAAMQLAPGTRLELAARIEENANPDFRGLQLVIADLRRSEAARA